jgi:hypothetical protein
VASATLIPGQPRANIAYYVSDGSTSTTMYNDGCSQGQRDAALGADSGVFLDFGGQVSGGTQLVGGQIRSYSTITSYVGSFAEGYYICAGTDTTTTLYIGLGTNNSLSTSSADGANWAAEVDAAENSLGNAASQVVINGASDMEPGWATVSATETWFNGYKNSGGTTFWNYGAASGCPTSGTGGCNNGWTQAAIYYLSWAGPAWPFPQIYSSTLAAQWANITQTQGAMAFRGSLSQYLACQQLSQPPSCSGTNEGPDDSWQQLHNDTGQYPLYSDDIGYS